MAPDLAGLTGSKKEVRQHVPEFPRWIEPIPFDRLDYAYDADKWTIRVLPGHIIDSHIIILYRLLTFARGDTNPLPGADELLWAGFSEHEKIGKEDLVQGYRRAASISEWMVNRLPEDAKDWNGLTQAMRDTMAPKMAIYAVQVDRLDQNIGKIVAASARGSLTWEGSESGGRAFWSWEDASPIGPIAFCVMGIQGPVAVRAIRRISLRYRRHSGPTPQKEAPLVVSSSRR